MRHTNGVATLTSKVTCMGLDTLQATQHMAGMPGLGYTWAHGWLDAQAELHMARLGYAGCWTRVETCVGLEG